ncbi:sugar ABC transporter permease [Nocardioides szechwanensis]|uniref:Carbohydrate ABC transporter membrane protein 1, CUT1 family n=1 Tax=Nocardioides szechwanensis TaxID=1005944 RepID=A0A1G9WN53_9ACTN|nr:sugar ABC transporter permease [Nocardioides szechwanensis]GEP32575.1 sugar ABC transporter permease [Nocardioides szechwanensis]SDM86002.1 carbohydrate ABC transporter membrane protein 1, CUT1 family [Nocardioides szechwanensis]
MSHQGAALPAAPAREKESTRRGTTRRVAPSPGGGRWRQRLEVVFFVSPALALMAVFVVWPVISAVRMSFYRWKGFGPMDDFVGLRNYERVLTDDVFTQAVTHNFIIVVASIVVQLPLGLAIAVLLNRRIRGRGLLRTIVFVPYVLAEVIAGVVWFQLLQPNYGTVDGIISAVGLTPPEQGFLGTPELALPTMFVVLTWKYLGLAVLLFLAGLQGVPEELYEAAQLDGASWWQVQRRVAIPLLGPTIRTWCFLSMIGSLQLFDMVWVLTGGGPANATTTMATYLINQGTQGGNYGIAGAASVVLFVIGFVMALAYQLLILRRDSASDR